MPRTRTAISRSKTSYFNGTVYKKNITRFWPVWASSLIIWLVVLPLSMGNTYLDITAVVARNIYIGIVVNAIYGAVIAMCVYSYMYSSKSTGFTVSLPIRREAQFTSCWFSGLTMLVGPGVMTFFLTLLLRLGYHAGSYTLLTWLAVFLMQAVFFYGLATLCAAVSGSLLSLPVMYVIINYLAVLIFSMLRKLLYMLVYGLYLGSDTVYKSFSPIVSMFTYHLSDTGGDYSGMVQMIIYCAAGVVMSIIGLMIYRHRPMEAAGDVIAVRSLKPVFRYFLAFACALVFGMIMYSLIVYENYHTVAMLGLVLAGGFIGYFASEMLMKKSFRVFGKWKGFAASAVIMSVIVLALGFDVFGIEEWIPKASEVKSVTMRTGENTIAEKPGDIQSVIDIHKWLAGEKVVPTRQDELYGFLELNYALNKGGAVSRRYPVKLSDTTSVGAIEKIVSKITAENIKSSGVITERNILYCHIESYDGTEYHDTEITGTDAYNLFKDCILPDALDSDIVLTKLNKYPASGKYTVIYIEYTEDNNYTVITAWPNEDSKRTNAALKTVLNNPVME